jgi:diguanylate cyclase (GGDEF)-like protein/PAS domain S-box-containing protein
MSLEILADSESRLRRVFNQLPALVWTVDRELRFCSTLGAAFRDLGLTLEASKGAPVAEFFGSDDDHYAPNAAHARALAGESVYFEIELGARFFRTYVEPLRDESGEIEGVLGVALDATAERRAAGAFRRSEENLAMAQAAAHLGSWDHDLNRDSVVWSQELFALCGVDPETVVPTPDLLWRFVHDEDAERVRTAFAAARADGEPFVVDTRLKRADGGERWVELRGRFAFDHEERPARVFGTMLDVTARKQAEADLVYQAHYDPLTQLPNRKLFAERLTRAMARAKRVGSRVAVLYIDLDRFKSINDTLGHAIGDALLQASAERIATIVRESDTIARHGSDEFIVILVDLETADDAARAAQAMVDAFEARFEIEGRDLYSSVSVGVSLFPEDGRTAEQLVRAAHAAHSRAKAAGGNGLHFYTSATHERAVEHLTLENELRRAFERGEFVLHYQPIVGNDDGIVAVEALVRWQHPTDGLVYPDRFIALCEEIGLMVPLGRWITRAALEQVRAWRESGVGAMRVAVNLSARQLLDPSLTATVRTLLAEAAVPADLLDLEITESAVMHDLTGAKRAVAEVKALGVGFSLDDFGTGYSSLAYLKHFPVDALKIDRAFVRDLPGERGDAAIVSAIVALGHALDLRVVAEGVETAAQAALLRKLGCDEQQGYHYAKPLPAQGIESMLRARRVGSIRAVSG